MKRQTFKKLSPPLFFLIFVYSISVEASFVGDIVTAEFTTRSEETRTQATIRDSAFHEFTIHTTISTSSSFNVNVEASSIDVFYESSMGSGTTIFPNSSGSILISDLDWQGDTLKHISGISNITTTGVTNFNNSDIIFGVDFINIRIGGSNWFRNLGHLTFDIETQVQPVPLPLPFYLFLSALSSLFISKKLSLGTRRLNIE